MADPDEPSSEDENKEYKIHRRPDLQVVTSGARIHYSCDWISPSARPTVASDGYWGPRDGIAGTRTTSSRRKAGSEAGSTIASSKAR
jgi:hypothetical protein